MANIPGMHGQIPGGDGPYLIHIHYNGETVLKTDSFARWIDCCPKNRVSAAFGLLEKIQKEKFRSGFACRDEKVLPEHYHNIGPFRFTYSQNGSIEDQFKTCSKTIKCIEYIKVVSYYQPGCKNYEEDIAFVQKQNEVMEPIVLEIINHITRIMKLTPFW